MKIYLQKHSTMQGMFPADQESLDTVKKLKKENVYYVDIKEARNYKFHKKFFSLLKFGFDNQRDTNKVIYDNPDSFRKEVILKCGFYNEHITTKGEILYFADSISFDKMDELEFNKLFDRAVDVIIKYFVPDIDVDEVLSYLN
ncbi:MAG: DUF1367 family protein [bacterium]|nr:DUF1367 family protein [bacterium]